MMWGMMYGNGTSMMGGFMGIISWAVFIWFIVFTVLVVGKLDRVIQLLEKK